MKTKHTPTPWTIDSDWMLIIGPNNAEVAALHSGESMNTKRPNKEIADANAAFIVEACNNYQRVVTLNAELVEALKSIIEWWEDDHDFPYGGAKVDPSEACQWYKRRLMMIANCARVPLAKAKEQQP